MSASERASDGVGGAADQRRVHAEVPLAAGHRTPDARTGQFEHPADVFGRDEMPGRAKNVGAHKVTAIEGGLQRLERGAGDALRERPERARKVLRLDRPEVRDDLARVT